MEEEEDPRSAPSDSEVAGDDALARTLTLDGGQQRPREADASIGPGTRVSRYMVRERIGEGGMGVVYLADDLELERKVALKFLHHDRAQERFARRLQREAQAMAKLSHPNVAIVYDVGTFRGQMFLAMPFIDGGTLRSHLEGLSDWKAKWRVLRDAGRGLAAAHAAGIVHRDFKPDNVLVTAEGVPVVTDFGLARSLSDQVSGDDALPARDEDDAPALTRTGAVVGTPRYMAPEQHQGAKVGPSADQFAYAVTVWELLVGTHPFQGGTSAELASAVSGGVRTAVPDDTRVPSWFRRAVDRALLPDPIDRFESVDDLVAALDRDPRARLRRWVAGGLLVAVLGGVIAFAATRGHDAAVSCGDGAARWAGTWDDAARNEVRAAFLASHRPHAETTWNSVARDLDAHVTEWKALHLDNCKATHERGEQSAQILDQRLICLDQRLAEARGVIAAFRNAADDPTIVDRAADAATGLTGVATCNDRASLAEQPSPTGEGQRTRVAQLSERIGEVRGAWLVGKYQEAYEQALALITETDAVDFGPLSTRAHNLLGACAMAVGKYGEAEIALRKSMELAAKVGDSSGELSAAISLLAVIARGKADRARTDLAIQIAQTAVLRAHPEPSTIARFEREVASAYTASGQFAPAIEHAEKAVSLADAANGRMSEESARAREALALALRNVDRGPEAQSLVEEALAIRIAVQGQQHPDIAVAYLSVADWHLGQGHCGDAMPYYEKSLTIREDNFGPDNQLLIAPLKGAGWCAGDRGDSERAVQLYERAIALEEKALGKDAPQLAASYSEFAVVLFVAKKFEATVVALDRATELARLGGALFADDAAMIQVNAGLILLELDRSADAARNCADAVAYYRGAADGSRTLKNALLCTGRALIGAGRFAEAEAALRESVDAYVAAGAGPADVALVRFALGRAIWGRGQHARGRAEVERALAAMGTFQNPNRKAIEAWLKEHR